MIKLARSVKCVCNNIVASDRRRASWKRKSRGKEYMKIQVAPDRRLNIMPMPSLDDIVATGASYVCRIHRRRLPEIFRKNRGVCLCSLGF